MVVPYPHQFRVGAPSDCEQTTTAATIATAAMIAVASDRFPAVPIALFCSAQHKMKRGAVHRLLNYGRCTSRPENQILVCSAEGDWKWGEFLGLSTLCFYLMVRLRSFQV